MVFVLIPGGEARLGIDWPDDKLPKALCNLPDTQPPDTEYLPNGDGAIGGHSFTVRLDPFLLSKYEMTHAQWESLFGGRENPSAYSPRTFTKAGLTMTHPVNSLSPLLADETVRRLGLVLPTSAQWQHAARAGSDAPWWTGFDPRGWYEAENLADASLAKASRTPLPFGPADTDHDDDHRLTAAVDSMRPNPFGLHHMLGNVQECSRDPAHKYSVAMPREGDGAMKPVLPDQVLDPRKRDVLGGSCQHGWNAARSTTRMEAKEGQVGTIWGLRPARALQAP